MFRVNEALQNLPAGLDETYNRMFQNIHSNFRQEVISLLKWLCFSNEILTLDMLADIFILHPECDAVLMIEDRLFSPEDVLKYLSGLVITHKVKPENERDYSQVKDAFYHDYFYSPGEVKVRLAHFSIKEYLTSDRMREGHMADFSFTDIDAHLWIARSCLAYHKLLSSSHFGQASTERDERLRHYATLNWPMHLEMIPYVFWPMTMTEDALHALSTRSHSFQKMLSTGLERQIRYEPTGITRMLQRPHFYAARRGYFQLTNLLLPQDSGANLYRTQEDLDLALQDAAHGGNKAIVEKLLHEGANVNAKGEPFGNALLAAISRGHLAIVNLLLDKGADIEAEGSGLSDWDETLTLSTPLQLAGRNGQLAALEVLLGRGAKINYTPKTTKCILSSTLGHSECFNYLLDNGADVNIVDCHASALYEAASRGYWDKFDLLLDKGADVNLPGRLGYPLHGLMSLRTLAHSTSPLDHILERMKRLLDLGADPNASTETSGTPLYRACTNAIFIEHGYMAQISLLLIERGADVNIFREKYGNAFQADKNFLGLSAMKLLLENGADISTWAQVGESGSVLHSACYGGDLPLVELLLDHGVDVHSRCGVFDSVLQAACGDPWKVPDIQILKLLLDRGVNVNDQGGKYGTALEAACFCDPASFYYDAERVAIVRFLLDHGADVNLDGGEYGTALQAACATSSGGFDTVHLLLDRGANIHFVGGKYGSAWHAAAQNACDNVNNLQLLQLLHEHGANVNHVLPETYPYATALHAVLSQQWYTAYGRAYSWKIDALQATWASNIQLLLDLGADVNLAGGIYGLPLQAACAVELVVPDDYDAHPVYTNLDSLGHGAMTLLTAKNCQRIDVNAQSGIFGTALQAAAYSGQTRSIRMLLERGAQISISGGKYRNALNAAVIRGHWDIVDILLEKGREQSCQFIENGDEAWVGRIRQEHGEGAVQRWEAFWKVHGN